MKVLETEPINHWHDLVVSIREEAAQKERQRIADKLGIAVESLEEEH